MTPVTIAVEVNGEIIEARVEPRTSLADFLRLSGGLTGTHVGCEHGVCGACTVVVDGRPVRSCILYAIQAAGSSVTTIEGFDDDAVMSDLRTAFTHHHALQCGYCTPGMLITARDIVRRLGKLDERRIREELAGNLCRCTGYVGIIKAIQSVGEQRPVSEAQPDAIATRAAVAERPASAMTTTASATAQAEPGGEMAASTETGATQIAQQFEIAAPAAAVWAAFRDIPRIVAFIPGAELVGVNGSEIEGRIGVKLGPIGVHVAGRGHYTLDEATKSGALRGSGQDKLSRSRFNGSLAFELRALAPDRTGVTMTVTFSVQGMLAHLARPAIVSDVLRRIVQEFANRMTASLQPDDAGPKGGPISSASSDRTVLRIVTSWIAWLRPSKRP